MNYKQIPKEYFTNLFVLWGLFVLILGNFNSVPAIKSFLNKLWMTNLNLIIFSIIFCVVVYFSIRTIFKNKPLLSRIKQNSRFKIVISVWLTILLSAEIAPYFTGIINIIAEENNVVTCACYPQLISTAQILGFIILPFLYVVFFHKITNVEDVDKLIEKLNKIKVDWKGVVLSKGYSSEHFGESKENIAFEIDYYRDTSITKEKDDQFKHIDYVKVLKDILQRSETPVNIGLYGRWGVGKSSILSMLKEQIEKPDLSQQFRYLYVDTWKLSPQTLKQEVLVELNTQLETFTTSQIEDKLYNVRQEMYFDKGIIKAAWPLLIVLGGGVIGYLLYGQQSMAILAVIGISTAISVLSTLIQFIITPAKRIIPHAVSSHQFDVLYEEMIRKEGKRKLAVVIDNLDRCNDEVAVELLGLIQSFMTKPNCINILACDDEAIINHLRQVKGESYTDKEGNEFLSKFFQVTIRIPPFIPENLDSYVTGLMGKRHNIPFHPSVKPVLISGAVKNPRKVNQFLNNVVALYRLADLKEGDNSLPLDSITKRTDFLTKIIILHHEWPKFYDELDKVQDPRLLDIKSEEFTNWFSKIALKPEQNEYEEQQFDGLKDFLTDTRYCRVDDIRPFLRLNQPSYEGEIQDIEKFDTNVRRNRIEPILDALNQADEKGKENHIKKMRDINDQYEKEGTFDGLLNSTQAMIDACEVIKTPSTREIALRSLGKCISSDLMKTHLTEYDLDKLFPLIKEMPSYFAGILYRNFIGYAEIENALNEKLIAKILENSSTIQVNILDEYDKVITDLSTKYEEKILDIIMKNCNSVSWNSNKFKLTQFITSLINKISFDNSALDNKRIDTYLVIQNFIDASEREAFVKHLQEIVEKFTNSKALVPPKLLEIIEGFDENFVGGMHGSLNKLFDSLTMTTTSMPDTNQRKRIFEILFKLIDITKGDTK